uniref:Open rectifier potassium channel protein 1-like n=1 Tax=Hirondellea gigas TaxID=1518452 RepID=A0A6A7FWM0_9CRUS
MVSTAEAAAALQQVADQEEQQQQNKGSTSKFLLLILVYVLFLLLGATLFMLLQYDFVETIVLVDHPMWAQIKGNLTVADVRAETHDVHGSWLRTLCPDSTNLTEDNFQTLGTAKMVEELEGQCSDLKEEQVLVETHYKYNFVDSLYFSMSVITTIGYGHIVPAEASAKLLCMAYAVVGVPLTGILLARTSDFFGEKIFEVYQSKLSGQKQRSQQFIVMATLMYIVLGFVVFLFLPAAVFHNVEEDWTYLDSVYFAFITLTTIGFGDYVTGSAMEDGWARTAYQVFVMVWIIISLGYWVMVANFIARALRSKRLHASLMQRARLLKAMMAAQGQADPVFLPRHSKGTMNFMLQLSSMLPEASGSGGVEAQQLQDALAEADAETADPEAESTRLRAPLTVPGIASLFNFPHSMAAMNKKICKAIISESAAAPACHSPTDTTSTSIAGDGDTFFTSRDTSPDQQP